VAVAPTDPHRLFHESADGRTEADWLDGLELLRGILATSLDTDVDLGRYVVDDFAGHACFGVSASVRGRAALPGCECDSWEGILSWSASPGRRGYASATIFPFRGGSVLQQRGRLADLGPGAETEQLLYYRLENGRFDSDGWIYGDGPGEWASVTGPGSVYHQDLTPCGPMAFAAGGPIVLPLRLHAHASTALCAGARASLVHVHRDREGGNLAPWTVRPPKKDSERTVKLSRQALTASKTVEVRLEELSIRGGWVPGRYYLAVRIQNLRNPKDWTWSCDISPPIHLTIVERGE
jgi:hypothetical protein